MIIEIFVLDWFQSCGAVPGAVQPCQKNSRGLTSSTYCFCFLPFFLNLWQMLEPSSRGHLIILEKTSELVLFSK